MLMACRTQRGRTMTAAVRACFFSEPHIVNTLHVILQANLYEQMDHIVISLLKLIQNPVCFALTDVGYAPFRADTTLIIPFDCMTTAQLEAIAEALETVRVRQTYHASTQMGGGLYMRSVEEAPTFFIDPALVLFASNVLVRNSVSRVHNKKNVSNIIIQRVLSAVNIDHRQITQAEAMSRAHFALAESVPVARDVC